MSSTEKLDVTDTPISQTFIADGSKSRMIIPPFQREYSWGEDQIEDFWNDNIKNGEVSSFIGSILVNPVDVKGQRHKDFEIVDGQQRITSIFLIKSALRDYCLEQSQGEKFADDESADLLKQVAFEINSTLRVKDSFKESSYKLKIGTQNRDFFENKILDLDYKLDEKKDKKGQNQVIKRFITNYFYIKNNLISNYIKNKKHNRSAEGLAKILDELRDNINAIIIIEIKAYDKNDAIDVFQTINDRGTDLEKADLIKAMLFKKITKVKDDKLENLDSKWNLMVENIQEVDRSPWMKLTLSKFLRYFWMSKYKFLTMSQLVRSFDKTISEKKANQFLEELTNASQIMRDLCCQSREDFLSKYLFEKNHYSYDHLMGIRIQGNVQCMVILLSYLTHLLKNKPKRMNYELFECIDNFTFLYFSVCHKRANKVEQLYSKFAIRISKANNNNDVSQHIADFNSQLKKTAPSNSEFEESFSQSINYKKRLMSSYLLARLELLKQSGEQTINWEQVNIDHVLPQNSLKSKKDEIPEKEYKEFEEKMNQIGNLVLISKKINSAKGAKNIRDGVDVILNHKEYGTDFKTTRSLALTIKEKGYIWDYPDILTRTKKLCQTSYKAFNLDKF